MKNMVDWPEVFCTGELSGNESTGELLSMLLVGWGNCHFEKPPENFGKGVVQINHALGILTTPDNIIKIVDKWQETGELVVPDK